MNQPAINVEKLTPEERLQLLERLWDSLEDHEVPLTTAQKQELDRRLNDLDTEGPRGIPREDVLHRLERKTS